MSIISGDRRKSKFYIIGILILLLIGAVALKATLLAMDAVPFNADEAIVALMARHILQGERPWFFYGQAYMGSLDAYLIAGAFSLLGESVLSIRVVQIILYTGTLLTSYPVARRITSSRRVALLTVLLLAFPPVLLTLYTTVTLGGYGETLLIGNLLLCWGHRLGQKNPPQGLWFAWGLATGLGFWVMAMVMVYAFPVALWLLGQHIVRVRQKDASPPNLKSHTRFTFYASRFKSYIPRFSLVIIGFLLGSLPWWVGSLSHINIALAELFGTAVRSTSTAGSSLGNIGMRTFNFVVFGLLVLFGLRYPWTVNGPPDWLAVIPLALYLGALGYELRRSRRALSNSSNPSVANGFPPRLLLWGIWGILFLSFILTPFGGDPSGRYFLPLYLPLFIFTAEFLVRMKKEIGRWVWILLAIILAFNLTGTVQPALKVPPGITTQFDVITQIDHRYYDELMAFLREHEGTRGYTNYWIAYPLAFLSDEEIILTPRLPYKADLRYTSRDNRYAPYNALVEASPTAVYVTSKHPELDAMLREEFTALGVDFREKQISTYHIFYDFSRKVTPEELDIYQEPVANNER